MHVIVRTNNTSFSVHTNVHAAVTNSVVQQQKTVENVEFPCELYRTYCAYMYVGRFCYLFVVFFQSVYNEALGQCTSNSNFGYQNCLDCLRYIRMYTHVRMHIHAHTHARTHAHTHTHTHTRTPHTHTHTRTHTHTHTFPPTSLAAVHPLEGSHVRHHLKSSSA